MAREHQVLYVEDDAPAAHLVREAFAESAVSARLHAVQDGPAALAFLTRERPFETAPAPDLVLLDLDLGHSSGFDVLEELRTSLDLSVPVVVFTSSDDATDVVTAYERGANAFVQKPPDFEGLVTFADRAVDFWGGTVDAETTC